MTVPSMRQAQTVIEIETRGPGLNDITARVARWVSGQAIVTGLLTIFIRHTSASLLIQENTDPTVRADLEAFLRRLVPRQPGLYAHDTEGPDDMPAHIRAALEASSLGVPVGGGRLLLGTWQALYLHEHRDAPHRREIVLHLSGEG